MFCDLNPDKKFNLDEVERQLSIKSWDEKKLITRRQRFKEGTKESCLDYLLSSNETTQAKIIKNCWSDHIPIWFIKNRCELKDLEKLH